MQHNKSVSATKKLIYIVYKKSGLFSNTSSTKSGSKRGIGTLIKIPITVKFVLKLVLFIFNKSLYIDFKDILLFIEPLYQFFATINNYSTVLE